MRQWGVRGGRDGRGEFRPVPDVLAFLAGSRRVRRSVRDLASGDEGEFTGRTAFSPLDGGGLQHHESGTFVRKGVPRPAERTPRFLPGTAPGTAEVRFADGRPFHDLDLTTGHFAVGHPCAADHYQGVRSVTTRTVGAWCGRWMARSRTCF